MKRREFLQTSAAASAVLGLTGASITADAAESKSSGPQEYFEMRAYRFKVGAKADLLHAYLETAAIPALNRLGSKPVGVFTEKEPKDAPLVFMLISYATLDAYGQAAVKLAADPDYQKAGADYLKVPKVSAVFDRIDSWLMLAFAGMPKLELPPYCREKKPRLFELRTYESYSESKALKKVEMFNAGEIDVMHEVGLGPIFYGQALIGRDLPHLTYMTSGENDEVHKQHWDAFGKHPIWEKLKNDPQYADTVSKMTKWILVPTPYSQI